MKVKALRNTYVEGRLLCEGKTYDIETDVSYLLRTGKLEKVESGKAGQKSVPPKPADPPVDAEPLVDPLAVAAPDPAQPE